MNIDYNEILQESLAEKISVHLVAKRKLNYKEKDGIRARKNCGTCKNKAIVTFLNQDKSRQQCNIIGVADDPYSDIQTNCVCNAWK